MIDKKIEQIRQQLNEIMISRNVDKEKLLEKSQELDALIVKLMEDQKQMRTKKMELADKIRDDPERLLHKVSMFENYYKVLAIDRILKHADKKMLEVKVKVRRVG